MKNLSRELEQLGLELGISEQIACTSEESDEFKKMSKQGLPLPDGVFKDFVDDSYYRYKESDLSENEIKQLLTYRQTLYLRSIKNSMIFFVVVSIISIFISFLLLAIMVH